MSKKWVKCEHGVWLVSHKLGMVISPPCGKKSCQRCARQRRKTIIMRVMSHITDTSSTHQYWFMTITPTSKSIYDFHSGKTLQSGWSKLRKRLARRFDGDVFWVFVREVTQGKQEFTDAPPFVHGHIILGWDMYKNFIPLLTSELSKISVECGLGWVCLVGFEDAKDVPMDTLKTARYVAKYATKANQSEIKRSISYSQNWSVLGQNRPKTEDLGWEYLNLSDASIRGFLEATGYSVQVASVDDEVALSE